MARTRSTTLVVAAVAVGAILGVALALVALAPAAPGTGHGNGPGPEDGPSGIGLEDTDADLVRFEDRADFQSYLREGREVGAGTGGFGAAGPRPAVERRAVETADRQGDAASPPPTSAPEATSSAGGDGGAGGGDGVSRIGSTNVQVEGLDEPDLVKAGDTTFHYSPQGRIGPHPVEPGSRSGDDVARPEPADTHAIDVSEPASPETLATIDDSGQLLRSGDTLVVLGSDRLRGYDVSEPGKPERVWEHELDAAVVTAREQGGTLYLVTKSPAQSAGTCPVEPLGGPATVRCDEIYHPRSQIQVEATYTALSIGADSGDVRDSVSFVGTARNTVVYVSSDGLYVTYTKRTGRAPLLAEYLLTEADEVPADVRQRIREIRSYDISSASKTREISAAIESWLSSLPDEERQRVSDQLREGVQRFVADHQRELVTTGIVRIDVEGASLSVGQSGTVPGRPLNQFSMGQHDGTLRITTTIPAAGDAESENDLYVLDDTSLARRGAVTGMGLNERVYSVRYAGDTAYVVTFRRIDPFHVIDLSNPADPTVEGELKLPGFSSYLHPIDDEHVLGIGEEDGEVKAVLFDVSDPSNPTVADDRIVEEGWSAIQGSHHAFTIDRKHGVFFLPAGDKGLVVDYTDGDLDVETSVRTDGQAQRARYVNDYLYVFGGQEVVVLDETSWERTETLELED